MDVINRSKQRIFTARDVHTSFTTAHIIEGEDADLLRSALICSTTNIRAPQCTIRIDNAPGFSPLKEDEQLIERGITLEFGRVKNPNKNPVAEKCNQELEAELLRLDPSGNPVSNVMLQDAVHLLNTRVRNRNLSAKELLFCRDQITLQPLDVNDVDISHKQQELRNKNHLPSALSKSKGRSSPPETVFDIGALVHIKHEGDKFKAREQYIIIAKQGDTATLQKLDGSKFMSKKYIVPFEHLLLISKPPITHTSSMQQQHHNSSSDSDSDYDATPNVMSDSTGTMGLPNASATTPTTVAHDIQVPPQRSQLCTKNE